MSQEPCAPIKALRFAVRHPTASVFPAINLWGLPLHPKVVTLFYGCNDHWIGFGLPDRDVARLLQKTGSRWQNVRLVQLGEKAWIATHRSSNVCGGVRQVGKEDKAVVCDLAAEFAAIPAERRVGLFLKDGCWATIRTAG